MLFCPYCVGKKEPSDQSPEYRFDDFGVVASSYQFDEPNKKTLDLRIHRLGCGKTFFTVTDNVKDECIACFKLPDEDLAKKYFHG